MSQGMQVAMKIKKILASVFFLFFFVMGIYYTEMFKEITALLCFTVCILLYEFLF